MAGEAGGVPSAMSAAVLLPCCAPAAALMLYLRPSHCQKACEKCQEACGVLRALMPWRWHWRFLTARPHLHAGSCRSCFIGASSRTAIPGWLHHSSRIPHPASRLRRSPRARMGCARMRVPQRVMSRDAQRWTPVSVSTCRLERTQGLLHTPGQQEKGWQHSTCNSCSAPTTTRCHCPFATIFAQHDLSRTGVHSAASVSAAGADDSAGCVRLRDIPALRKRADCATTSTAA